MTRRRDTAVEGEQQLRIAADRYLQGCFDAEEPPRVSELALLLGLTIKQLSDAFFAEIGERPSKYLKSVQVNRAKWLLTETDLSTNEVAYRCGFGTRMSFFRAFKRMTGTTPRTHQFRK